MEHLTYEIAIGNIRCVAIHDFQTNHYTAANFFTNSPSGDLATELRTLNLDPERLPSPISCLLVESPRHKVLIDTGLGAGVHPIIGKYEGRLAEILQQLNVDFDSIDIVVFSHAHPDHIGGVVDELNQPRFPHARHVLAEHEWVFWMSEVDQKSPSNPMAEIVRTRLGAIGQLVSTVVPGSEVVTGIYTVDAKGHTPGHMAISIRSEGDELLYTSDTVLHPLHLKHPDWITDHYDNDVEAASRTKKSIFDYAALTGCLVHAFHFNPFPSLGTVAKYGSAWKWQPLAIGVGSA